MKVLYLDCFSGISGDMTVGALCDLGVKPSTLEWELAKVEIGDFHMHFERKHRLNVEGVAFGIHAGSTHTHEHDHGDEEGHGHDDHHHEHGEHDHHEHDHHEHDHEPHSHVAHEHEHGHEHTHADAPAVALPPHDHEHGDEVGQAHHHHHEHDHPEEHHHQSGGHAHGRSHHEIRELIEKSELSPFVKKHALSIFQRIAVAEGKIHGMPPEKVTFHEVGALDSIADIICACVGLEALGVEKVFVSELNDGTGWVDCAHGRFPLPAPATLEILTGISVGQIDEPHELITPTGAAIVAEFGAGFGLMPRLTVEKIGYGVGARNLTARPNVLRAVLGTLADA